MAESGFEPLQFATSENSAQVDAHTEVLNPQEITSLTLADLEREIQALGKQTYRAKQIFKWIYQRHIFDFDKMSDLSKVLRAYMKQHFVIPQLEKVQEILSEEDNTRKFLFRLADGKTVESVLIYGNARLTLCVSSQVGCAMACSFCNTGDMGIIRNLKTFEIVGQYLYLANLLRIEGKSPITNIVYMGMGEPMHNLDAVIDSIHILCNENGSNLSHRKITVSTSGLVPQIEEFGRRVKANLAISLNATTDTDREEIMPINRKWPLAVLLEACRKYPLAPNRRITFEYVMLGDFNDSMEDAKRIPKLLNKIPSKVNLIPYNPHPASQYKRPELERVYAFQRYLLNKGMNATVRISKGKDIYAACGQLRSAEAESRRRRRQQKNPQAGYSC